MICQKNLDIGVHLYITIHITILCIPLKFHQNLVSNRSDIIEFVWGGEGGCKVIFESNPTKVMLVGGLTKTCEHFFISNEKINNF